MRTIIRNSFLVVLGWRLVPTTSLVSITGISFILVAYGLAGLFGFPRLRPENLHLAGQFGRPAGGIFAGEIILE
jgi:hypothetical protein